MSKHTATLVRISGRVQGVGFRAWTREQSRELGLSGWVRNEKDGSVAALLVGPENAVWAMLDRMRTGPQGARVDKVATEDTVGEADGRFVIAR